MARPVTGPARSGLPSSDHQSQCHCSNTGPPLLTELPPLHTDPCLGPPGRGLLSTTCSSPEIKGTEVWLEGQGVPAATELAIDISHITKTIILIKYKDKGALELGI